MIAELKEYVNAFLREGEGGEETSEGAAMAMSAVTRTLAGLEAESRMDTMVEKGEKRRRAGWTERLAGLILYNFSEGVSRVLARTTCCPLKMCSGGVELHCGSLPDSGSVLVTKEQNIVLLN